MSRKLNLNEEEMRKYLREEGHDPEESGLIMATLKNLFGKDRPMGDNTLNNPDVLDNYYEKIYGYKPETRELTLPELQVKMETAIMREDYMEAARLRDLINSK